MDYVVGNVYSFNTLAPSVLGASFKNSKILGIVSYEVACTQINVDLMQRAIYPLLPVGTVDNPKKYTYLMIETESGSTTVLATAWIDQSSVSLVQSVTIHVTVPNVDSSDTIKIRDALRLLGYADFSVTVS